MVQNKPEWEVKVTDTNSCEFMNIKLSCTGFKSVTTIESSVLSKADNGCLLNNGHGLFYQGSFAFKYVWDTRYDFKIIDATIACS
ncbi:unnamed protein product [Arabis nemorensis]|uniref:Uncharacterized protein n=1 Tax=Arabis nemorensis TaxID=586526 RepID=A0A565C345_9BRAS|nr:unnamed protein product [Arabis nemorensis]